MHIVGAGVGVVGVGCLRGLTHVRNVMGIQMKKIKSLKNNRWWEVRVQWIDSVVYSKPAWFEPEESKKEHHNSYADLMVTCGFAFDVDDQYLYLARSAHYCGEHVVSFGDMMKIPLGCITKIEYAAEVGKEIDRLRKAVGGMKNED